MIKQRLYRFDNIKFILIFLVVFGHMLEFTPGYTNAHDLYRIIYSFHMPVFIFVTGYFSKFSPRKMMTTYLWPYFLLQTIFLAFVYFYIEPPIAGRIFQYSQPFWILWYFVAIIGMNLFLPLFDTKNKYLRILYIVILFAVALYCGKDVAVNVPFCASKVLVFMPFFVLGYYTKNSEGSRFYPKKGPWRWIIFGALTVLVILCIIYIGKRDIINYRMMLGQYSYVALGYGPEIRGILLGIALIWTSFFMNAPLLDKKIPVVSYIGQYTFPIFAFHGFILKFIAKNGLAFRFGSIPIINSILITVAVVLLLGNPVADKVFRYCFTLEPLLKLIEKRTKKKDAE